MNTAVDGWQCGMCHEHLLDQDEKGYGTITVYEDDKEIVLIHCPNCGTLHIRVETARARSR
jgi:predicted RNA-binding Zn-ribbon protein involved in translation (DUF1610 family)